MDYSCNYDMGKMGYMSEVKTVGKSKKSLDEMPLGIAYVPMQEWGRTYELDKALDRGTIFPVLDLPFCGSGGCHS